MTETLESVIDGELPRVICTVDVVLLTLKGGRLWVKLVRRDRGPFQHQWALPGGYVHPQDDATTLAAAARVLQHKAGVNSPYLEQLATFSGATRDPRGWSISVVHYALVAADELGLSEAEWQPQAAEHTGWALAEAGMQLAFDHDQMVQLALERVRNKSAYSSLPAHLCGQRFTLPQLQAVYEQVLGEPLNKVSFRRKMDEMDMLEALEGEMSLGGAHRPAQLYRLKPAFKQVLSVLDRGLNPGAKE